MHYPRRYHRATARDGEPCQCIGERPAHALDTREQCVRERRATSPGQPSGDQRLRFFCTRPIVLAQFTEEPIKRRVAVRSVRRAEKVPGTQQIGVCVPKSRALVLKETERNSRIEHRVVPLRAKEPGILIVLDEMVIGVGGEGEWVQTQRVDDRQAQQRQVRAGCFDGAKVVLDDVVAQQVLGTINIAVKCVERGTKIRAGAVKGRFGVCAHRADLVDATIALSDFQVERNTAPHGQNRSVCSPTCGEFNRICMG